MVSMDEQTQTIYSQFRNHLLEGRKLSFMQFDKAILTLSGGGLALSLTFIHNIVPIFNSFHTWTLVIAWILFAFSVMTTLISFISSQFAFDRQLKLAEEYYVENNDKAFQELNKPARFTNLANIASASAFILAVVFLLFFVSINIVSREVDMYDNKKSVKTTDIQKTSLEEIGIIAKKGLVPPEIPVKPPNKPAQPNTDEGPVSDSNADSSAKK